MKLSLVLTTGLLAVASAAPKAKYIENDKLADRGLNNLKAYVAEHGYPNADKCTLETAYVRKEWYAKTDVFGKGLPLTMYIRATLSRSEKRDYIKAVQCLGKKPAKTPSAIAAGAKSRYDDLVVTHIQQSLFIHGTANFLSWHRYFTWTFEQMLRNECGYKGYQPYYNWAHWSHDPKSGPFFDGSEFSMSGDGAYISGRNYSCFPYEDPCLMKLQPGSGGGCVTSGPFKEYASFDK
jgi:tyrosinase